MGSRLKTATPPPPPHTCSSLASFDARSLSARSPSSAWQATSPFTRSSDSSAVRSMIYTKQKCVVGGSPLHVPLQQRYVGTEKINGKIRKAALFKCVHCHKYGLSADGWMDLTKSAQPVMPALKVSASIYWLPEELHSGGRGSQRLARTQEKTIFFQPGGPGRMLSRGIMAPA